MIDYEDFKVIFKRLLIITVFASIVSIVVFLPLKEIHFQEFMEKEADSRYVELFQKMNAYDKDHESRIRAYMDDNGIQIGSVNSQ